MAPVLTQKLRVQQALVALVKDRPFPIVVYDEDGNPSADDTATKTALTPILCNEVDSAWADDENNGRELVQTRAAWRFALRIKFDAEVLLELFEDAVCDNPPVIALDSTNGLPFVRLRLVSQEVQHPVQQQSSSGTIVEYIFEAEEGRR